MSSFYRTSAFLLAVFLLAVADGATAQIVTEDLVVDSAEAGIHLYVRVRNAALWLTLSHDAVQSVKRAL